MAQPERIALAFPLGMPHHELLIEGVLAYAREHGRHWSFLTAPESMTLSILDLKGWKGAGIIAKLNLPAEARFAAGLDIPMVNVSGTLRKSPVARVTVDNREIGRLAAEHLIDAGFRHLAFYGVRRTGYSHLREVGFRRRLDESGADCAVLRAATTFRTRGNRWFDQHQDLIRWIGELEKPLGLFVVSDYRARLVIDACQQHGLSVPEDVALVSVDNERTICEHCEPKLTSVDRNARVVGYRSAEVLDKLIRGQTPDKREILIPPKGLIARASSDTLAIDDPRLRDAIAYIQKRLTTTLKIEDILTHTGMSRRWLEYAFREFLGESPHQYIGRKRVIAAKELLQEEPDLKLHEIAAQTGFARPKQLTLAFQRYEGMSPREYRQANGSSVGSVE